MELYKFVCPKCGKWIGVFSKKAHVRCKCGTPMEVKGTC